MEFHQFNTAQDFSEGSDCPPCWDTMSFPQVYAHSMPTPAGEPHHVTNLGVAYPETVHGSTPGYNFWGEPSNRNSVVPHNSESGWARHIDVAYQSVQSFCPLPAPPFLPGPNVNLSKSNSDPVNSSSESCRCGCGGGPMIPQRQYKHPKVTFDATPLGQPIVFKAGNRCGIPVADILNDNFSSLVGADDPMLTESGTSISLRFEWPDYEAFTRQIRVRDWRKTPQPINRSKLATEIAKKLLAFIEMMENMNPPKSRWRVGAGAITAHDLVLLSLEQVGKASWQPRFRML